VASTSVTTGANVPPLSLVSRKVIGNAQSLERDLVFVGFASAVAVAPGFLQLFDAIVNNAFSPLSGAPANGYAKLMAFYTKCWVLGGRVDVQYATDNYLPNPIVGAVTPERMFSFGLTTDTNAVGPTSMFAAISEGLCEHRLLGLNPDTCRMTGSVDVAKFVDKPYVLDDPQFFSTSAAGPSQLVGMHGWVQNHSTATFNVNYVVVVTMRCMFTDPLPFS